MPSSAGFSRPKSGDDEFLGSSVAAVVVVAVAVVVVVVVGIAVSSMVVVLPSELLLRCNFSLSDLETMLTGGGEG